MAPASLLVLHRAQRCIPEKPRDGGIIPSKIARDPLRLCGRDVANVNARHTNVVDPIGRKCP
jgi:hypothetical protein